MTLVIERIDLGCESNLMHVLISLKAPSNEIRRLKGYIGSITFSSDSKSIVITSYVSDITVLLISVTAKA